MAPVALDELLLAGNLLGVRLAFLRRAQVSLGALAVVGRVVAPEGRDPALTELPDARHGGVQEGAVVRGDEQRPGPAPEVLLEPLEGAEVEVIGRLVEEQELGIGDDEAGQGGPRLLPARQRRRRPPDVSRAEAEAGERGVDPLVERVAPQDVEAVLEVGVVGLGDPALALEAGQLLGHPLQVAGAVADRGPEVGRGHERLVEVGLLGQQPEGHAPFPGDRPRVWLVEPGGDPEERRLAGAVRAHQPDPVADGHRRLDPVEDHEGPDLAA